MWIFINFINPNPGRFRAPDPPAIIEHYKHNLFGRGTPEIPFPPYRYNWHERGEKRLSESEKTAEQGQISILNFYFIFQIVKCL